MNLAERMELFDKADLYPVLSSGYTNGRNIFEVLEQVCAAGTGIVQMREKNLNSGELYEQAVEFRRITSNYGALLIINDRLDIALASGADGVHLGQEDLPADTAKKLAPELIIGYSTHNASEIEKAAALGADYINIGPVFETKTKNVGYPALGIDGVENLARDIEIPFTVMGGIKSHHIPALVGAGVKRIAMVTEITMAPDIFRRVKDIRKQICGATV